MKKLSILAVLLSGFSGFGQLSLENTYTQEYGIVRVNLEYSGEKYYGVDQSTHVVNFYNADHSFWKSIPLIVPPNPGYSYVRHVSESKINPDNDIEIAYYSYYLVGATSHTVGKVISENGTEILTSEETNDIVLSEIEGLPLKIIANNSNQTCCVFDLSGNLEHFYDEGSSLKRVNLEISGEKYYLIDKTAGMMRLFNPDHSSWKTIALPKPVSATYNTPSQIVSETVFNADSMLEVSYGYYQSNFAYESKLINENGEVLLTAPNTAVLYISHIDGYPDKLVARQHQSGIGIYNTIYEISSLMPEHTFPTQTDRILMETGDEKYFTWSPDDGNCVIYNGDYSVWKSIPLQVPAGMEITYVPQISQFRVNDDALVELTYGYSGPVSGVYYYEWRMINELGNVLLTVPNCVNLQLLAPQGLQDKLLGLMYIENSGYFGTVYGLSTLSTGQHQNLERPILYPNPADDVLYINGNEPVKTVEIYNQLGSVVRKIVEPSISTFGIENLGEGIYLVRTTDISGKESNHKIVVSH